jgi:hypothetical protein
MSQSFVISLFAPFLNMLCALTELALLCFITVLLCHLPFGLETWVGWQWFASQKQTSNRRYGHMLALPQPAWWV